VLALPGSVRQPVQIAAVTNQVIRIGDRSTHFRRYPFGSGRAEADRRPAAREKYGTDAGSTSANGAVGCAEVAAITGGKKVTAAELDAQARCGKSS
jgi:hypothetical protein